VASPLQNVQLQELVYHVGTGNVIIGKELEIVCGTGNVAMNISYGMSLSFGSNMYPGW